jgi:hypothetical protein|tara:strand:+ start:593 stop:940 length:348 start_codon:yes stop_codon:yes gene_type:complete
MKTPKKKKTLKDKFWKMKQSDRIEYLLHEEKIRNETYGFINLLNDIRRLFVTYFVIFILGVWFYVEFNNLALLKIIPVIGRILKFVYFVLIVLWLIDLFIIYKNIDWLKRRFKLK